MMDKFSLAVFLIVVNSGFFAESSCEVLLVPEQFASIQEGLDATTPWDTVLVAPGVYHEFLTGPPHSFTLSGLVAPDDVPPVSWTVLDPIPLPDSDTPSAFVLTADSVYVRNFVFFNRPEMRQLDWPTRTGGIRSYSTLLDVQSCHFDSVSAAIDHGMNIQIRDCRFSGCLWKCVWTEVDGLLKAQNCAFDGSGQALILAYDNSIIDSCEFQIDSWGHMMGLFGTNIAVRDCRFGPSLATSSSFYIWPMGGVLIENCVFEALNHAQVILEANIVCGVDSLQPITIRGNTFRNFQTTQPAIQLWCQTGEGDAGLVERNVFEDGGASTGNAVGISVSGSAILEDNIFENLIPEDTPDVFATSIVSQGTLIARDNHFLGPGLAARASGVSFDARWNWWGDSTGPFNASLNPEGQGTEVGNEVEFIPWLSRPDSIDTTNVAVDLRGGFLPSEYSLSIFPNPFNAVTTLMIEVARAGEYEVLLYDVTGRIAANLFSGRIATSQQVSVDAAGLASGVYFAQLRGADVVLAVGKLLLIR